MATLSATNLSAEGQSTYDFTVTYADETAVDVSTLGQGDIRVTGPNGFTQVASFVGVDAASDGTPRTATYRISAPNSVWQASNNGAYTVRLLNARVEDTLGNANAAANLGSFNINITDTPDPEFGFIGLESSTVSVDEAAGTAQVTVLRTGGSDGEITVDYSTVSSAGASAATAGEDYQSRSGTLTFADGVTQQSVLVPILDDTLVEGAENFGFAIDNVQGGATLLAPRTAQITINDDDTEPEPPPTSQGNGLRGEYFNNINFTSQAVTRTDANIDFNWGSGSPDPSIGRETFSVRWSGQIEPLYSETYTFRTNTDDGIRLWVNNQLIIDQFVDQAPTEHTGTITLVAGEQYDIRMDYYENRGGAVAQLSWESASQALEIVPRSQLYSEPVNSTAPTAETVVSALDSPIAIDWRAGSDQMFIAEKSGVVRIFENGSLLSTPFIDISAQVNDTRDRGLIDLAIHPNFINNPYVYLSFTYDPPEVFSFTGDAGPDGDNNRASRVIRVTADAANGYRTAVPGSEVVLLGTNSTWDNFNGFVNSTFNFDEPEAGRLPDGSYLQDFLNSDSESHTIGAVEFGPDGALYVSNGDGTSYNRVDRRSARVQDVDSLSGKVLRIDPITGQGLSDNPFFNGDANANRSKVYQLGLRNPFRFTIDPDDGQLYIGDVGWTLWEEINAAGAGANFGWPYYEGGSGVSLRTGGYEDLPEAQDFYNSGTPVVASLLGLNHIDDGINAIVMGDIYKGNVYGSEYQGDLFFNDLGQGIVRNVSLDAQGNVASVDTFATGASFVVQMIEGPDGLLYYVNLVNGTVGRWVFD
ncbi:MAG: PQQ-dependent sugar dehydrogenase [Phormidesmis sp.]